MDFSKSSFSWGRPLTDYSKVQWLLSQVRRNNRYFVPRIEPGAYLNVGCGPNIRSGYVNVDYNWRPGVDLCVDITKPFPIGDGMVGGIYMEHCLEHLPLAGARAFFKDCLRMMRPGAVIRLIVPDLELYARTYVDSLDGKSPVFPNEYYTNTLNVNQPVALINELFYGPDHRFNYDYRTLAEVLQQSGFVEPAKLSINQGQDPKLLIDDRSHVSESLYVEARKPPRS